MTTATKKGIISKRARAIPPFPLVGYELPRTVKGVIVTKLLEVRLLGFVITIKRERYKQERKLTDGVVR